MVKLLNAYWMVPAGTAEKLAAKHLLVPWRLQPG